MKLDLIVPSFNEEENVINFYNKLGEKIDFKIAVRKILDN